MQHNDDILFDRLVDGELSGAERRRLLESLDQRPAGWRRCALAFLEAQSWGEGLADFARRSSATREPAPSPSTSAGARRESSFGRGIRWLAIAASLLLAFMLGIRQRDNDTRIASVAPTVEEQIAAVEPPAAATLDDVDPKANDALTLWVRDDQGQPRSLRVPLVDAGALDQQLGLEFQPGLPADVRNRLQDRGFNVQSKRRYAPLWLENGRPMIVPVEDTKIVPLVW